MALTKYSFKSAVIRDGVVRGSNLAIRDNLYIDFIKSSKIFLVVKIQSNGIVVLSNGIDKPKSFYIEDVVIEDHILERDVDIDSTEDKVIKGTVSIVKIDVVKGLVKVNIDTGVLMKGDQLTISNKYKKNRNFIVTVEHIERFTDSMERIPAGYEGDIKVSGGVLLDSDLLTILKGK